MALILAENGGHRSDTLPDIFSDTHETFVAGFASAVHDPPMPITGDELERESIERLRAATESLKRRLREMEEDRPKLRPRLVVIEGGDPMSHPWHTGTRLRDLADEDDHGTMRVPLYERDG